MRTIVRRVGMSALAALGLLAAGRARADVVLYATSLEGQKIVQVDVTTNTQTTFLNTSGQPDSLIFTPTGNLVYTSISNGQVIEYNPTTMASLVLSSGLSSPQDLVLDPSGTSVTFSDSGHGNIDRVNLSGGPATVVGSYSQNTTGLAYDSSGHLFAGIGGTIDQIDPTTGAILHTGPNIGLDGLTYNSGTGLLYGAAINSNVLYSIDPTTLAATQLPNTNISSFLPDGIISDGGNLLYIASRGNSHIYQYNLTTHTLTQQTLVSGLDDLAPASGLGAPAATPEPSSFLLAGLGVGMAAGRYWWKRRRLVG